MSRITPLVLLVLVGALGWLALRQVEREEQNAPPTMEMLFPDVRMDRLAALRLESIRRDGHYRLESDGGGRWFLVDPLRWPANLPVLGEILQLIERNRVETVPDALVEEAEKSFKPPRGFIETIERLEDGSERRVRVEVGAVDLDGIRIYVRRDGKIYRTLRNIEYPFDIDLVDLRAKRLFALGGGVADVERVGGWIFEEERLPMGFSASARSGRWLLTEPVEAPGDPHLFAAWLAYLGGLEAKNFASDVPEPDLTKYGLQTPAMTIRVTNEAGGTSTLHLGQPEAGGTYAQRERVPTIYVLGDETIPQLTEDWKHFLDVAILRFQRADVRAFALERDGAAFLFQPGRAEEGSWTVTRVDAAGDPLDGPRRADAGIVDDLLTSLEAGEVRDYALGEDLDSFLPVDAPGSTHLTLRLANQSPLGVRIAGASIQRDGTELVPIHRDGDSVGCVIDPELAAHFTQPLEHYLDRYLWKLSNARLRGLEIGHGDGVLRYERADAFDWRASGSGEPARALDPVLDHLLFLRADRHVAASAPLSDVVTVTFTDGAGERSVARIGRGPDGDVRIEVDGGQAVARRSELHADLLALFE